jgi:hypothetical protein
MTRMAHCCCGSLKAEVKSEPVLVQVCNCIECQRRTGSVFGVSSVFPESEVHIQGPSKVYVRDGHSGQKVRLHFCPDCGTTVYGKPDVRPGVVVIFTGTFADPNFPAPTRAIWEQSRHPWVTFTQQVEHFPQAAI